MAINPINPGETWGIIRQTINLNFSELNSEKANISELDNFYQKSDFIDMSEGVASAGKPVKLNASGEIDSSMLDVSVFTYVGPFTPTSSDEYPDTTGVTHGSFWGCEGVDDTNGYTFSGGDLAGRTINNGDFMVWSDSGWSILLGGMDPSLYYKLNGSNPLTAPFAGGGQQIKNIADGTDVTDAATVGQLPDISGKEDSLGVPSVDGQVLSSDTDGNRSWIDIPEGVDPIDVYFLNGSQPIVAPFAGGGQQIKNIADGTDVTDAATIGQIIDYKDLTPVTQIRDYRRSVIALCSVDNTNNGLNSFSSGKIIFHRVNGLYNSAVLEFCIEKAYNNEKIRCTYNYNKPYLGSIIRPCTFIYNGQKYGGFEVYISDASANQVYFYGKSNFDIFGVDYYDTQNDVSLVPEINNSLDFDAVLTSNNELVFSGQTIKNISDGVDDSDVATVGQTKNLKTNYNNYNGVLITFDDYTSPNHKMITLQIRGNSYNDVDKSPYFTEVNFYWYNDNNPILKAGAITLGVDIGDIHIFRLNGKLNVWFYWDSNYSSPVVRAFNTTTIYNDYVENINLSITNSKMPTSGVTDEVVITPKIYTPFEQLTMPNLDNINQTGVYGIQNTSNPPPGCSRTNGTLIVVNNGTIQQLFQNDMEIFTRRSSDGGTTWTPWMKYKPINTRLEGTTLYMTDNGSTP